MRQRQGKIKFKPVPPWIRVGAADLEVAEVHGGAVDQSARVGLDRVDDWTLRVRNKL